MYFLPTYDCFPLSSTLFKYLVKLSHVDQQVPEPSIRLHGRRQNLARWQHKTIIASIPQLNRKDIFCRGNIIHIINGPTCHLIDGGADRSILVLCSVDGFDGGSSAFGEALEHCVVLYCSTAGISVRYSQSEHVM